MSVGEFSYAYMEQQDENTFVPRIGKRAGKKDIIKAEIKLIEYTGICLICLLPCLVCQHSVCGQTVT